MSAYTTLRDGPGHDRNASRNVAKSRARCTPRKPRTGRGSSHVARIESARGDAALEHGGDDRAAPGDEDLLHDRGCTAHRDRLDDALHRLGAIGPTRRPPVGGELLPEEVGRVGAGGGDAPRRVAVEAGREGRSANERRAGQLPPRRAQMREVPRRRDRRSEVRVVGEDRGTRCGPRSGDGPGVRAAGRTHQVAQAREVVCEPGERLAGTSIRRRDDRLPRGVGRLDRLERLGAIGVEDREARQFGIPVARRERGTGDHRTPARPRRSMCSAWPGAARARAGAASSRARR